MVLREDFTSISVSFEIRNKLQKLIMENEVLDNITYSQIIGELINFAEENAG